MEEKEHDKMGDIPKKDIFKVPDGYFDSLQDRIDKRLGEDNSKVVPFYMSKTVWYVSLAAAAMIALLIIFRPGVQHHEKPVSIEEMLAMIPVEDCIRYLHASDIDAAEIIASTDADFWTDAWESEYLHEPSLNDEEIDLLYERYGVTEDDKLQTL